MVSCSLEMLQEIIDLEDELGIGYSTEKIK